MSHPHTESFSELPQHHPIVFLSFLLLVTSENKKKNEEQQETHIEAAVLAPRTRSIEQLI
jgi:hypothetical protein